MPYLRIDFSFYFFLSISDKPTYIPEKGKGLEKPPEAWGPHLIGWGRPAYPMPADLAPWLNGLIISCNIPSGFKLLDPKCSEPDEVI